MSTFTDDIVNQWLQDIATSAFVSLHYDTPVLDAADGCEITGGGYLRSKVSFTQPSNRAIWSTSDAKFSGLADNTITHFGIWNKKNRGMLLAYGSLPKKRIILNGQGYVIKAGELALSFA